MNVFPLPLGRAQLLALGPKALDQQSAQPLLTATSWNSFDPGQDDRFHRDPGVQLQGETRTTPGSTPRHAENRGWTPTAGVFVLPLCRIPPESTACAEPGVPAAHRTIPPAGDPPSATAPAETAHPAGELMPGRYSEIDTPEGEQKSRGYDDPRAERTAPRMPGPAGRRGSRSAECAPACRTRHQMRALVGIGIGELQRYTIRPQ